MAYHSPQTSHHTPCTTHHRPSTTDRARHATHHTTDHITHQTLHITQPTAPLHHITPHYIAAHHAPPHHAPPPANRGSAVPSRLPPRGQPPRRRCSARLCVTRNPGQRERAVVAEVEEGPRWFDSQKLHTEQLDFVVSDSGEIASAPLLLRHPNPQSAHSMRSTAPISGRTEREGTVNSHAFHAPPHLWARSRAFACV